MSRFVVHFMKDVLDLARAAIARAGAWATPGAQNRRSITRSCALSPMQEFSLPIRRTTRSRGQSGAVGSLWAV